MSEQPTVRPEDATTRALSAVEAAERLAVRAAQSLADLSREDLDAAPAPVRDSIETVLDLLGVLADTTTTTTCSLVKDQDWSDEISRRAAEKVRRALSRIERAHEDR